MAVIDVARKTVTLTSDMVHQLRQLGDGPVWDGDLISKPARTKLIDAGLAERGGMCPMQPGGRLQSQGCNQLTDAGRDLLRRIPPDGHA